MRAIKVSVEVLICERTITHGYLLIWRPALFPSSRFFILCFWPAPYFQNNQIMSATPVYKPKNSIRIVTATALFDGHDASVNIMRRILQGSGAEVIHLGHNRSVGEIVDCAIQEDVQAVAITSYQGGHNEFFTYMRQLLDEQGGTHILIFGGGGGVILPDEITALQQAGIERIYSPDDGRAMGLQGMINDLLLRCDFPLGDAPAISVDAVDKSQVSGIARLITTAENFPARAGKLLGELTARCRELNIPVVGITGTGGAGKSSLTDELVRRFLACYPHKHLAVISVDPSRRKTGGALLGDRIRMNSVYHPRVFMRSLATRRAHLAMSRHVKDALCVVKSAGYDLVLLESSGIGQSDTEITQFSDLSLYVMTPDFGAPTQLEKIAMLDYADLVVLNKFDKSGALDALRDVRKQYQRNQGLWESPLDKMPVYATTASRFNDPGVDRLYGALFSLLGKRFLAFANGMKEQASGSGEKIELIPPARVRYLSEIADSVRKYNRSAQNQSDVASRIYALHSALGLAQETATQSVVTEWLEKRLEAEKALLTPENQALLDQWPVLQQEYGEAIYRYRVRDREIELDTRFESLSGLQLPKVALPDYRDWGAVLRWRLLENVPGQFPFAAGVFPFRREAEEPTRMFAGEGGPERTNRRFHYLSAGMPARRLSTAYDSVTLYGEDPGRRPDIYGKIGNAGVSIASLDDTKKLYSGFNLAAAKTSVSMTINGPAPAMTAFFLNAAIDQQCELWVREQGLGQDIERTIREFYQQKNVEPPTYQGERPAGNEGLGLMFLGMPANRLLPPEVYREIKGRTLSLVRGTVQADILKEDQAQNTCIFSTDFSLKMMGDMQAYFIENSVRNFYSVSISGYHIAEAGANPITQLAFTLANGFTYLEYYRARGMDVNAFAPNLSFFFSNGLEPEYSVLGRVARQIWAKALKFRYQGNERAQKLKYHIQTSGRSLHAQEINFNDIRTTLQALSAIYDNCNSLHTNAYDEAITTPTEESVRRAMAIQLIINRELGMAKNENPLQGAYIIRELTELVEEAVLKEFDRITDRGGVLGAMESMYQRGKIQEESLHYEALKHTGQLPVVGVNTFLSDQGSPTVLPREVIRSTQSEKDQQIEMVQNQHKVWHQEANAQLAQLQLAARHNKNVFAQLMEAAPFCSLGQITQALYEVGGRYRRSM